MKRMSVLIPLLNKRMQSLGQVGLVREVFDRQSFALQNAQPLLHLILPLTIYCRVMKLEAWMFRQPLLHLLARVHP